MNIKSTKYIFSLFVTIIGIIVLISGGSYAILSGSSNSSNIHIVKAGSVELEVNEKYNTMETGFSIMKDADGLMQETVFEFTITNIGSVPAKYDLKLLNEAPSGQTALSSNYIRIGLQVNGQEMGPMGLSNVSNVIDSNTINQEEVIRYKMRVWLDKNQASGIQSNSTKKAYLKLKVEAKQSAYTPKANNYVYSTTTNSAYNYNPLTAGTYTGYCAVNTQESYNSCTDHYGYLTQAQCREQIANLGGSAKGYSCTSGTWTVQSTISTTTDVSSLNKTSYLRYILGTQNQPLESYVCYILNSTEYCLKGGDGVYDSTLDDLVSPSYESNKQILNESFGSNNCNETNKSTYSYYGCLSGSLNARAYSSGGVNAYDDVRYCGVDDRGYSRCGAGGHHQ